MDIGNLTDLWRDAMTTAAVVGAPFLLVALAVGLFMSLLQAATQIQENILAFVPKIIAIGLVMALAGSWIVDRMARYTTSAFEKTVDIGRGERQ